MTERLTSLEAVKDWLGIATTNSDAQLVRLIDAASQFVLGWLNRDSFQATEYRQRFRGMGKSETLLRNWPVISITSVGTDGINVPAAVEGANGLYGSGYVIGDPRNAPQLLELYGYWFAPGAQAQVEYVAGFRTSQTTAVPTVAEGGTYALIAPNTGGLWSDDLGVTLDGVAATLSADATPAAGEYYVDEWGTYYFNAANVGDTAVLSYDYTPWAVSHAVTELIGEWYRRKDRIGVLSKTLSGGVGETITFGSKDMGESIRSALQLYQNVVPV